MTLAELGFTRAAVAGLAPPQMEAVAAYLFALLAREPLKSSAGYAAERIVLGSLANELRTAAAEAGEPVGLQRDLRNAESREQERHARDRMAANADRYFASARRPAAETAARSRRLEQDEALVDRLSSAPAGEETTVGATPPLAPATSDAAPDCL